MFSPRKIWWLRLFEKLLVTSILIVVGLGIWRLAQTPEINSVPVQITVAVLVAALLLLLIIQNIVDHAFSDALVADNQSDDEKFRSLYDSSPTPHVTVDLDGTIIMFNPAAVRLLRAQTDSLARKDFYAYITSHAGHDPSVLPSKIKGGVIINDEEVSIQTQKGEELWALMSAYVDKKRKQSIISLIDITQQKRVDAAKSEFVALATHQLRTPIAAIKWNFELLSRKLPDEVSQSLAQYLSKVDRNIIRMIALIDDFLSVSQIETGTFAASPQAFNLSEFFNSVLDEYAEKITEKNIQVVKNEEPAGFTYVADSRLFHIIVSNLVSNAVKYMQPGGTLSMTYHASHNKLTMVIEDDGIGIPLKEQEHLFQRFFRASNARSHQTEGTGLGLYVVKQSVEQLGGEVTVSSAEDHGAVFTVTLPIKG